MKGMGRFLSMKHSHVGLPRVSSIAAHACVGKAGDVDVLFKIHVLDTADKTVHRLATKVFFPVVSHSQFAKPHFHTVHRSTMLVNHVTAPLVSRRS